MSGWTPSACEKFAGCVNAAWRCRISSERRSTTVSTVSNPAVESRQARATLDRILERHPDPPDLPPRDYDVHDRSQTQRAIAKRLSRRTGRHDAGGHGPTRRAVRSAGPVAHRGATATRATRRAPASPPARPSSRRRVSTSRIGHSGNASDRCSTSFGYPPPLERSEPALWLEIVDWMLKYADHDPDWADACLAVWSGHDAG